MEYQDFVIAIEPRQGGVYIASAASPAGDARSSFRLPYAPDEVGTILDSLGRTMRGGGQAALRDAAPASPAARPSAEDVGGRLFAALFSGPVRSVFDQSLGMMHGKELGLRIKIRIDPEDPSLAQLASLPWEFLYRRETRDWLNLSRYTPVVRYLDVQRPHAPLELRPPLRILVVMAQPAGYPPLDLAREREMIESTWARLPGVEVSFLAAATALQLAQRLSEGGYHALHYMGHGSFDERIGQGVLLLEDEGGQAAPIAGPTLGMLLHDVPSLRLATLNACETARFTKEKGLDPFAGVASALVMAGLPAVVAMQFPISDDAAITFADSFYRLLSRGTAVDAAVAEGRRAIVARRADTLEWGTPVLFMRAPNGVIFDVVGGEAQLSGETAAPERPQALAQQLEEANRLIADDPRRALEALGEIRRQEPGYPGLAGAEADARAAAAARKSRARRRRTWTLLTVAGLALAAILFFVFRGWLLPAVPPVAGKTLDQAQRTLGQAGLKASPGQDGHYDETVAEGHVIRTDPPAGTWVIRGSEVKLLISLGRAPVPVPSVAGLSQEEAAAALAAEGLHVDGLEYQYDETLPVDQVIGTLPEPEKQVDHGSGVTLVVSVGPMIRNGFIAYRVETGCGMLIDVRRDGPCRRVMPSTRQCGWSRICVALYVQRHGSDPIALVEDKEGAEILDYTPHHGGRFAIWVKEKAAADEDSSEYLYIVNRYGLVAAKHIRCNGWDSLRDADWSTDGNYLVASARVSSESGSEAFYARLNHDGDCLSTLTVPEE